MRSRFRAAFACAAVLAIGLCARAAAGDAPPPDLQSADNPDDDRLAETEFRPGYALCLQKNHAVRPMEECTAAEIEFQKAEEAREYQTLLARWTGAPHDRLQAEEAAWSQTLDARCLVFSRRRGSLGSMKAQDCWLYGTALRRVVLAGYAAGRGAPK